KQVLGLKTRGQVTLVPLEDREIVLAKAGIKAPMTERVAQNNWFIDLFLNRTTNTTQTIKLLRTLPEIYRNGGDLVSRDVTRRVSMEFDWNAKHACPGTR